MERRLRGIVASVWTVPAAVLLFSQWEIWLGGPTNLVGPRWATSVSSAAAALLLAGRRRAPLLVQIAVAVVTLTPWLVWGASETAASFLLLLISSYSVGRWGRRPAAYAGIPVAAGLALAQIALDPLQSSVADGWGWSLYGVAGWGVGAWLRQRAELDSRRDAQRAAQSRAELAEERLRIARDLHDVLANSLGVIIVHAEAAEELLAADPGRAAQAMRRVQATGRDSLREVRALLEPLRADSDEVDQMPPPAGQEAQQETVSQPPGLADVERLVTRMRSAGLPVTYERVGDRPVPEQIGEVTYRVLQESLTNVVRHAGRVTTHARLSIGPNSITIDVANDRPPQPQPDRPPSMKPGNGILGMHERVQAVGGTLDVSPGHHGGFQVSATIPLAIPAAADPTSLHTAITQKGKQLP